MKRTLIIHPKDKSTEFLKPIYSNIKHKTIIEGGMSKNEVFKEIDRHDRIIMMGHGAPTGLFSVNQFPSAYGYIIDYSTVPLLRNKECIFIWCNADQFVKKYDLKGLYSGMFISEVSEATYCGLYNIPQKDVTESNDYFAKLMSEKLNDKSALNEVYDHVYKEYGIYSQGNKVANYNHERLFIKTLL